MTQFRKIAASMGSLSLETNFPLMIWPNILKKPKAHLLSSHKFTQK